MVDPWIFVVNCGLRLILRVKSPGPLPWLFAVCYLTFTLLGLDCQVLRTLNINIDYVSKNVNQGCHLFLSKENRIIPKGNQHFDGMTAKAR